VIDPFEFSAPFHRMPMIVVPAAADPKQIPKTPKDFQETSGDSQGDSWETAVSSQGDT
jgi:hypothetical protein